MGPYNITQVDVPGILGVYQGAQQARAQQMMAQRQMARQEAADDRDIKRTSALAKVFAPKGGDPASSGAAPTGTEQAPVAASGPPGALVDPAQLPPRTDGLQINQDALRELYTIDPETAHQVQTMAYNANKQQFETMQRNGEAMATVAYRLKQMPLEARKAELQAWAPQLQGMGLTPEMLAQADLTDAGLDRYYTSGRKLSEIIAEAKPDWTPVPRDNDLVNLKDPAAIAAFNAGGSRTPAAPPPPPGFEIDGGPTPTTSGGFPGR